MANVRTKSISPPAVSTIRSVFRRTEMSTRRRSFPGCRWLMKENVEQFPGLWRDFGRSNRCGKVHDRTMSTKESMDRRRFLKASGMFACGLTGAAAYLPPVVAGAEAAPTTPARGQNILGPREPYSPHIGTLVSMLNWMRGAILEPVQGLTVAQLDYLHDAKANTIGAMLLHLAAVERLYQIHTFEDKKWGDLDDEDKKQWDAPALLGEGARKSIKGNNLAYY